MLTREEELIMFFLAITRDDFKLLSWPKNNPKDRGSEVLWQVPKL